MIIVYYMKEKVFSVMTLLYLVYLMSLIGDKLFYFDVVTQNFRNPASEISLSLNTIKFRLYK